jgi:hypothetical protein
MVVRDAAGARYFTLAELNADKDRRPGNGFERIWVTARTLDQVLGTVGMSREHCAALKDQVVVCMGEGASTFGKQLEKEYGAKAMAFDWWYGMSDAEITKRFLIIEPAKDNYWRHVPTAEARTRLPTCKAATKLEAMPLRDGCAKLVVLSNVVYWYFNSGRKQTTGTNAHETGWKMLGEAVRLLARGGQLRFDMTDHAEAKTFVMYMQARFPQLDYAISGKAIIATRN